MVIYPIQLNYREDVDKVIRSLRMSSSSVQRYFLMLLGKVGDIRGIMVHNEEFKVTQYADDKTLLLEEDYQTIVSVIRVLKWFKSVSGVDINKEKTKLVKLGATRDSSILWQGKFGLNWTDDFEILGNQYNMKKLHEITDLNIQRKMGEIQKLIRIWSSRNLTPYGKVVIIKSLLISKITHMLICYILLGTK